MKFHVEHNVTPNSIQNILPLLSSQSQRTTDDIYSTLQLDNTQISRDYVRRSINLLVDFKLVLDTNKKYLLTETGNKFRRLLDLNQSTFYDLFHYLYYASWDFENHENLAFSWTYQNIVKILWQNKPSIIEKPKITSEIISLAQEIFPSEERISLSHYAVEGATHWLFELQPPFILRDKLTKKQTTIQGRNNCSPELFVLAIQHVFLKNKIENRSPMLLDENKIDHVCEICLLDVRKFKTMLDSCMNFYGNFRTQSSEWGLSIILDKKIMLQDLF